MKNQNDPKDQNSTESTLVPTKSLGDNQQPVTRGSESNMPMSNGDAASNRVQSVVHGNIILPAQTIGGRGGGPFRDARYDKGAVVSSVEAWAGESMLRGIEVKFSDGTKVTHGKKEGKHYDPIKFDYASGERIIQLSLWGNGAGTRCGAIRIKTNKGKEFMPKMTSWGLKTEYKQNVGAGILLGVEGRSGNDIDSLGFLMLDDIDSVTLTDVQYNFSNTSPITLTKVYESILDNKSNEVVTGRVSEKVVEKTGGEWSVKVGLKFGQDYKVKGGIPLIAEGETTTKWEVSVEGSYKSSWEKTIEYNIDIPLPVPPMSKFKFTVSFYKGELDSCPFKAIQLIRLKNGGRWEFEIKGEYSGVNVSQIKVFSEEVSIYNDQTKEFVKLDNPVKQLVYSGEPTVKVI